MAEIRHSSLYCPRDFDISPYFDVVKPTIAGGFNYKALRWASAPQMATDGRPGVQLVDTPQTQAAEESAAVATV